MITTLNHCHAITRRTTVLAALVALTGTAVVLDARERRQEQAVPVFRSEVLRVRLDAVVLDGRRPIGGLTANDFDVRDNGVPITDLEVTPTSDSLAVIVARDIGWSVVPTGMMEMHAASLELFDALSREDQAWVMTFTNRMELLAGPVSDRSLLRHAVPEVRRHSVAGNYPSVWDAVFGAVAMAEQYATGRAVTVVFSDGIDGSSWMSPARLEDALRRSDVVVNVVRPRHAIGPVGTIDLLEDMAHASGGVVMKIERGTRVTQQFVDLLDGFRSGYVLSYSAAGIPPKKDGWHDVQVRLKHRKGSIRVRPGYFEPGR